MSFISSTQILDKYKLKLSNFFLLSFINEFINNLIIQDLRPLDYEVVLHTKQNLNCILFKSFIIAHKENVHRNFRLSPHHDAYQNLRHSIYLFSPVTLPFFVKSCHFYLKRHTRKESSI